METKIYFVLGLFLLAKTIQSLGYVPLAHIATHLDSLDREMVFIRNTIASNRGYNAMVVRKLKQINFALNLLEKDGSKSLNYDLQNDTLLELHVCKVDANKRKTLTNGTNLKERHRESKPFTDMRCTAASNSDYFTSMFGDIQTLLERTSKLSQDFDAMSVKMDRFAEAHTLLKSDLRIHQENITVLLSAILNSVNGNGETVQHLTTQVRDIKAAIGDIQLNMNAKDNCTSQKNKTSVSCVPKGNVNDSCTSLWQNHSRSGVYRMNTPTNEIVDVYCDMITDGGGWTLFQRRQDGSVDFYRDWVDYKHGFGNVCGEFWLGNDNLHELTSQGDQELRVDLWDWEGNYRYAVYNTFFVDSEANKYKLTIGGYSGNATDSFISEHNGMYFSTKDKDNDRYGTSCATLFKGGWWYQDCHYANLNGLYLRGKHSSYADGINWHHWLGYYYSLKKTEMKIRPKQ